MTLIRRTNNVFPSIFDDFFGRDWLENTTDLGMSKSMPAVNIREEDKAFEIELFAPGLDKKDFKVELDDNRLMIGYENKRTKETKEDKYTRQEFRQSSFMRTFTLPKTVKSEKIDAKYIDGVLKLNIPKEKEDKQKLSRLIEIS